MWLECDFDGCKAQEKRRQSCSTVPATLEPMLKFTSDDDHFVRERLCDEALLVAIVHPPRLNTPSNRTQNLWAVIMLMHVIRTCEPYFVPPVRVDIGSFSSVSSSLLRDVLCTHELEATIGVIASAKPITVVLVVPLEF